MVPADERDRVEVLCDRILRAVERTHPHIARSLNGRLAHYRSDHFEGLDRKLAKVAILAREQRALLRTIKGSLLGESSPASTFTLLDKWAGTRLNAVGELTGGNFRNL